MILRSSVPLGRSHVTFSDQLPHVTFLRMGTTSLEISLVINKTDFMAQTKKFHLCSMIPFRRGIALLLVAGLYSCSSSTTPSLKVGNFSIGNNVTLIQEIKPETDQDTIVYIQGQVEKQVTLVKQWAYQISDSTGKIWVITNQPNLKEGEQVVIKGKVRYKSIPLADQEFGEVYIEES